MNLQKGKVLQMRVYFFVIVLEEQDDKGRVAITDQQSEEPSSF